MNKVDPRVVVKVGVGVDLKQLQDHFRIYAKIMGRSMAAVLKHQARLFCQDMLDYTLPVENNKPGTGSGTTSKAKQEGMDRVAGDIEKVFLPIGYASFKSVANADDLGIFTAWLRERRAMPKVILPEFLKEANSDLWDTSMMFERFKKFARKIDRHGVGALAGRNRGTDNLSQAYTTNIKGLHESARGGPRNYKVPDNFKPYFIVDYDSKVPSYIKRVQKRVGKLKAGWYTAGKQLGNIKAPSWVIGNQWGTGIVVNQLAEKMAPAITVGNSAHRRHTAETSGGVAWIWYRYAIYHRAYSMRLEIAQKLINSGRLREYWALSRTGGPLAGGGEFLPF
jgi:hypothetical protein